MATTRQVKAGAAYVELTTKDAAFLKGLAAAKKRLEAFGAATRAVGMRMLSVGATSAVPLAASVAVYASFDDQMLAVKGVTQATAEEFDRLRDKAKLLGATTSYTASQVGSLMTELGRAGFKPDQIIEMTGAVMDMARATGTDATLASGIMAATIRQFGLEATDATRVADGFTAAANKTFNSVEALGEAFQYAGPVAADAGLSLEETLAVLGTLGNVGIQGSEAGTALRRLLTLSAAEAKKFADVFGVQTADAAGNTRKLVDVLADVAEATKDLPTGQRMAKFNEVFGLLGITAASAIGKSVANTRQLFDELQNAQGTAAKTAKEMDSGLGGSFRILLSSIEGVAIALGEALAGPLQKFSAAASGTLGTIIQWIEANHKVIRTMALVLAGIAAAGATLIAVGIAFSFIGLALGGFGTVMGVVAGAITVVGSLLGALLTPIGLVLVSVLGLGAYLLYASEVGTQALSWLAEKFTILKDDALASWNAIATALASGNIALAAKVLWALLKMEWQRGVNFLTSLWLNFKKAFLDIASSASFGVARVLTDATAGLEATWIESIAFLADSWSLFQNMLTKTWHTTVGFIRKAWTRLKSLFDADIDLEAEIKEIDAQTQAKNQASETVMLESIGKRDVERQQSRQQIEDRRTSVQQGLGQLQDIDQKKRDQQFQSDMQASQREVEEARRAWQSSIDAVSKSTGDSGEKEDGKPQRPSVPEIQSTLDASRSLLGDQQAKVESKGGFNALALAGLGSDSLSQRTAKATEQVAFNTKTLADQAKRGRLVFTE